jgi:hypothetical protein
MRRSTSRDHAGVSQAVGALHPRMSGRLCSRVLVVFEVMVFMTALRSGITPNFVSGMAGWCAADKPRASTSGVGRVDHAVVPLRRRR